MLGWAAMSVCIPGGPWKRGSLAVAWLTAACLLAGTALAADPPRPPLPFKQGEKLTYHFYWGLFMVGRGIFEVTEVRADATCVFKVTVKSNDFISAVYPVEDEITSEYESKTGRAVRFQQNRHEGDDHVWEETFFYYGAAWASTADYNSGEVKWFAIPKDAAQDKLSTVYHMRTLDWKDRESATVLLGNDKENYKVNMKKTGTEKLGMDDFAEIPTFKVEPNTEYLSGFVKKGKMEVWVSDDAFRIPVRVESKLSVGTVCAVLVDVEGVEGWPYDPKD